MAQTPKRSNASSSSKSSRPAAKSDAGPESASAAKKKGEQGEHTDNHLGWFDRFATRASKVVSRAGFFAFCVLLVILWAPSIAILHSLNTWQLIINTLTTIVTFLLVALLQNSQERSDKAVQDKLNAIADSLSSLMRKQGLKDEADELRAAVGLEDREGSKD